MEKRRFEALEKKLIFWDGKIQKYLDRVVAAHNSKREVQRQIDTANPPAVSEASQANWNPADMVDPEQPPKPEDRITPRLVAAHGVRRGPFAGDITSLHDIQQYFHHNLADVTRSEMYNIRIWLGKNSHPLPQDHYRIPSESTASADLNVKLPTIQRRLKCIRNPERWATATNKDVVNAYVNRISEEV